MYRKILVPVLEDGSSSPVLDYAANLAENLGAELVPLRVITVVPVEDYFFKQIQVEEGSAAYKAKAATEAYLAEVETKLRRQGISARGALLVSDKAEAKAIVDYAQDNGCDLIVLPNQARRGVGRWLFSSLGEKVRRRSPVPVLFV
jgi:nucleotide-binding universal stress UspA family protein